MVGKCGRAESGTDEQILKRYLMATSQAGTRIGVDVGGTFTDLVRFDIDPESGQSRVTTAKTSTTPPDFERGVLEVLRKGGVPRRRGRRVRQCRHSPS